MADDYNSPEALQARQAARDKQDVQKLAQAMQEAKAAEKAQKAAKREAKKPAVQEAPAAALPRTTSWAQIKELVKNKFPKALKPALACGVALEAMKIGALPQPIGVLLLGPPAGQKTTALRFFKKTKPLWIDDFSSAAFLSHKSGANEKELKEIDLIPKMEGKALIVPEFASVLEGSEDKVAEKLGRLTRIMDGDGFASASGTHGLRAYDQRFNFIFLGASVPLSSDKWDTFIRVGSRFVFVQTDDDMTFEDMLPNDEYRAAIEEVQAAVAGFFNTAPNPIPTITKEQQRALFELAGWVAKLRGVVASRGVRFTADDGREAKTFQTDTPIIEAPPRLYSIFAALAQGHASIHGRPEVGVDDLWFIYGLALGCGRSERVRFLVAMPDGESSVKELVAQMHISKDTIRRRLAELVALGLVETWKDETRGDKPVSLYSPIKFANPAFAPPQSGQQQLEDGVKRSVANNKEGEKGEKDGFNVAGEVKRTPANDKEGKDQEPPPCGSQTCALLGSDEKHDVKPEKTNIGGAST